MALPGWVDELRERYLADAGHVFLLYGATRDAAWEVDGEALDCEHVLRRFLKRTRPIVGTLRPAPLPSRLEFAELSDRPRFENLIKAYDLLAGRAFSTEEGEPMLALARIWRALSTTGTDQAYLITDAERLVPGHRKHVAPIPDAPDLLEWPTHPTLLRSNNVIVLLAATAEGVHPALREAAVRIEVPPPPVPEAAEPVLAPPTPPPTEVDLPSLRADLARALAAALAEHPAESRTQLVPVVAAVAAVAAVHRPGFSPPEFTVADGALTAASADGERFLALWRGDIALDAAGTMLVKNLAANPGAPIDETAVAALARRAARLIAKL